MLKKIIPIFVVILAVQVMASQEIDQLAQEYINHRAAFYPVWATSCGIHDYDSLLTDYSSEAIFNYRNNLAMLRQKLGDMDAGKLKGDDLIDYKLLLANIKSDDFFLSKLPLHARSAALYVEEVTDGIYLLLLDNSRPIEQKAPLILSRMRKIGDFIEQRWEYQNDFATIYYDTAIEMLDGAVGLIEETSNILLEAMPDSSRQIVRAKQNAIADLKTYKTYCKVERGSTIGSHVIGKDGLDYLLKNVHYLDFDSDSLKQIGWYWYKTSKAAMDSLQKVAAAKGSSLTGVTYRRDLTKQDILDYYQLEINETAAMVKFKDIITVPDDIGACIPVETPLFMRAIRKGIAYMPPPPFSTDQTGYFYVRPIASELDSAAILSYCNMIQEHGFRGSVVHEAYPGHHLQLSIANRNPNPLRQIQQNLMLVEGWALYGEQMALEQGLYSGAITDERWHGVYGGIMFRAVRVIVDCSLAEGSMTPDSALIFMNNMLGENTEYYTAEIRRYCANPTQALSYLIGKVQIMEMLEKARKKEGNSFSLKAFHDKLLAEGSIPPALIAVKLGYK